MLPLLFGEPRPLAQTSDLAMAEILLSYIVAGNFLGGKGFQQFGQVPGFQPLGFLLGFHVVADEFLHFLSGLSLIDALFHCAKRLHGGLEDFALLFLELVVNGPEYLGLRLSQVDFIGQESDLFGTEAFPPSVAPVPPPFVVVLGRQAGCQDNEGAEHANNLLHSLHS